MNNNTETQEKQDKYYQIYQSELHALRGLAEKRDFSADGDAQFQQQFLKTKAAYAVACEPSLGNRPSTRAAAFIVGALVAEDCLPLKLDGAKTEWSGIEDAIHVVAACLDHYAPDTGDFIGIPITW